MSLNRTLIEWCRNPDGSAGWSWNPVTGCLNHIEGFCNGGGFKCYAYRLAHGRLKQRYLANNNIAIEGIKLYQREGEVSQNTVIRAHDDPFYPRFRPERLAQIERPPAPSNMHIQNAPMDGMHVISNLHAKRKSRGIFTCDMSDLFGIGIPEVWIRQILDAIRINSVDRFYLLTKQPQNLPQWEFPDNCWVGVSATNQKMLFNGLSQFLQVEASVKYISFEPLQSAMPELTAYCLIQAGIKWVIIGSQTKPYKPPKIEWVQEIVRAADKAGVKVFLKYNLVGHIPIEEPFYTHNQDGWAIRQEMPE